MTTITTAPPVTAAVVGRAGVGLIVTGACLAGALLTMDFFGHGSRSPSEGITLGVVWLVGTIVSAAILTSGGPGQRAITVRRGTLLYFFISFGILSIGWRGFPDRASEVIDRNSLPLALLVTQVAVATWALGFRFLRLNLLGSFMSSTVSAVAPKGAWRLRSPYVPILLYGASAASTAYRLQAGTFAYLADSNSLIASPGSLGPLLQVGSQLGEAAIVVAAIGVLVAEEARVRAVAILTVLTAAELGLGAFSGTKTPFVLLAAAVAVPFFASRRRIPWIIVVAGVAVFAIGTSFTGSYRERLLESGGRLQGQEALDAFTATALETLQPIALANALADGGESMVPRLRQIDNVAIVVQRTPADIPYRGADNLVLDPVRNIVPRALWPSKPAVTTGLDFSRDYFNLPITLVTASAITIVGDLYRHGGILAVIIGMALLGATARLVDEYWHPFNDVRLAILYASVFLTLVNLELDVSSLIISIPSAVFSGLIASRIAFARSASV